MKTKIKITVFVASMALTFGSLTAIAGPKHFRRMHQHFMHHGTGNCNMDSNPAVQPAADNK